MKPLVELAIPLPDVLEEVGGEYRVKGHRITLCHVISAHRNGIAPHAMVFYYPTLSLFEIERVFSFYEANQSIVDEFLDKYQAILDEQRRTGKVLDIAELRRRYEAKMATERTPSANGHAALSKPVPVGADSP